MTPLQAARIPILTTASQIEALAEDLAGRTAFAVDLEGDSLYRYQERVCLIQISVPGRDVLVDTLALRDLAPLKGVFAERRIRKVFHAADYDIRSLYRDFGIEVAGLFDTMVASQLLGEEGVGLADVLNKSFGVTLDKKFQRADWAVRPLPPAMISYAVEDTRHLLELAGLLEERLRQAGRLDWAAEDFRLLEGVRPGPENAGPFFLRLKGANLLSPRQLAVAEQVLSWRDTEARRRDIPPFKVLGNRQILDLALAAPVTGADLRSVPGLSPRLADRYGKAILGAVRDGAGVPEGELPRYPRGERALRDRAFEKRLASLKAWRTKASGALGISPGILINNALLEEIARAVPRTLKDLANVVPLKKWQHATLGQELLRAIRNQHIAPPAEGSVPGT